MKASRRPKHKCSVINGKPTLHEASFVWGANVLAAVFDGFYLHRRFRRETIFHAVCLLRLGIVPPVRFAIIQPALLCEAALLSRPLFISTP